VARGKQPTRSSLQRLRHPGSCVGRPGGRWPVVGHRQSHVRRSVHVPYAGAALQPGQRLTGACASGMRTTQSLSGVRRPFGRWPAGQRELAGDWITPDWDENVSWPQPAPLLRRGFGAGSGITPPASMPPASAFTSWRLNGQRMGDAVLTPAGQLQPPDPVSNLRCNDVGARGRQCIGRDAWGWLVSRLSGPPGPARPVR